MAMFTSKYSEIELTDDFVPCRNVRGGQSHETERNQIFAIWGIALKLGKFLKMNPKSVQRHLIILNPAIYFS